jgi:outer membrane protein assembly factor BamB
MKARLLVCIVAICLFGIFAVLANAEDFDWPRWHGPNGDGISLETDWDPEALKGEPRILWNVEIGPGHSNVAIQDSFLFTMGTSGRNNALYCLNAETGEEIWRHIDEESFRDAQSTPAIDGKHVYSLSGDGIALCLRAKNGKVRWSRNIVEDFGVIRPFYEFAGSPVIEGDLIILTANTSGIALHKKTGELVWGSDKPPEKIQVYYQDATAGTDYSTPVMYDDGGKRYAVLSSWKGIHAVEVKTGEVLWIYEWELYSGAQIADPLVFDDKVFLVPYIYPECVLLDIRGVEPRVLWKNEKVYSQQAVQL